MEAPLLLEKPKQRRGTYGVQIRFSEIVSALSFALDLTEGQQLGHSVRACVIGMRLGQAIGIPRADQEHLYYSLLLKDAGCSSNASRFFNILGTDEIKAKRDVKNTDWTRVGWESLQYALDHVRNGRPFLERAQAIFDVAIHNKRRSREMVQIRCERGASIARRIGLSEQTADAIRSLDEHWDGQGHPVGLRGTEIPVFSRILNLAQTLDVFRTNYGPLEALEVARKRSGRWFEPALVRAAMALAGDNSLFAGLDDDPTSLAVSMEPTDRAIMATEATLDNICLAFAEVVDAKSPFTYCHSNGVADAAVCIATRLGLPVQEIAMIRRAALLHDIGKLSVSNAILEKPSKLDNHEWEIVKRHPFYTQQILDRVPGFRELSEVACSHHEKLDGSGYFRNLGAVNLSTPARILVVADVFDALSARRPYRDALPLETVFDMMRKDAPRALDASCLEALESEKN